jgi:hypothetical protein
MHGLKALEPRQREHRVMPEFRFDPPLTLKGNTVIRNLDDAVRFMVGYRKARRPELLTSVLHRLEGAAGEAEERDAALAFRGLARDRRSYVEPDQ